MAIEGKDQILFLTRNRFYYTDGSQILTLDFPTNVVKDLDVVDKDGFHGLITSFIVNNKLVASQIFFVLSESVCFIKNFDTNEKTDFSAVDLEAKLYIDSVPFTSVVTKTYKNPTNVSVVVANQDLIDSIFMAFEDKGFGVSALFPASMISEIGAITELTLDKAKIILDKKDLAITSSMVGERTVNEQHLATSQNAVPKNKFLPYLMGVFVVLIFVFVWLMFFRG